MIIDQTVTIGNILEAAAIIGGGLLVFLNMKTDVRLIKEEIKYLKEEQKSLKNLIVNDALTEFRLERIEDTISDLRHGRGFVRASIEGEYKEAKIEQKE